MKLYMCGWCGQPTNQDGDPLPLHEINALKADWNKAELLDGLCCLRGPQQEQERRVTREMAMDAGDPSIEGIVL